MRKHFTRPDMEERNKQRMKNYDGIRFNFITVLKRDHLDEKGKYWFLCKCDCGKEFLIRGSEIGKQKSCGCKTRKILSDKQKTHGESKTQLYEIWHHMKDRCYQKTHHSYSDYGGRGIKVCDEWKNDYVTFRDWALQNGYDKKAEYMKCTLDRIDVNGNYEPSNCRWVSMKTQCNNRRNNRVLECDGVKHTMKEWSEIVGIQISTLWRRWKSGWSSEDIIKIPLRRIKRRKKVFLSDGHN